MKPLLSAFVWVLLILTGLSTARAQTEIRIEPQFADPAAVSAQVSFILSSDRVVSATGVTRKESPEGIPVWTLEAVSAPSDATLPPTPERASLTYSLGAVPAGTSGRLLWKLDGKGRAESSFTVPPAGIRAAATLSVNLSADGATARVHVDFREYAAITAQSAPLREDNRFILRAAAEPVGVIQIFPPPPFPSADLGYSLGKVPAGEYTAVFQLNGAVLAEKRFVIPRDPVPVPAGVTATFTTGDAGTVAHVRITLPDPYFAISDDGTPVRSGQRIEVSATLLPIATLVALPSPKIIEQDYRLGVLEPGEYRFVFLINGGIRLSVPFRVGAVVGGPRLLGAEARFLPAPGLPGGEVTGVWQGAARLMPSPGTAVESGELRQEGGTFHAVVRIVPRNARDAAGELPAPVELTWHLGLPGPGPYVFKVTLPGDPVQTAEAAFRVKDPSPPDDVPLPIVACLVAGSNEQGRFVDLCLAWTRPGYVIRDWGTPVPEGNHYKTRLVVGKAEEATEGGATLAASPGAEPELLSPDGPVTEDMLRPFREIGGRIPRLERHRYPLGALAAGDYRFSVCVGDRILAGISFTVPGSVKPKPSVRLSAEPVRREGREPARFTLTFEARSGWAGDPTAGPVTVVGPNGYTAKAARLSGGIISMDPLGRVAAGEYQWEPPGGSWDAADNGRYGVLRDPAAVVDREGQSPDNPAGRLLVRILPEPQPPPAGLEAHIAVSMEDGKWIAEVSFDNTGNWWLPEWGAVSLRGADFVAEATLRVIPPELDVALQASFSHRYVIGELKPGPYRFHFRSNAGHSGSALIEVPGVETPTPLETWKFNVFGADHWRSTASSDEEDTDHDGLSTLAEFVLGGNPLRSDVPHYRAAIVKGEDGADHLALLFHRAAGSEQSVDCVIEVSPDLKDWQPAGDLVRVSQDPAGAAGTVPVCACQTAPLALSRHPYMRLRFRNTGE